MAYRTISMVLTDEEVDRTTFDAARALAEQHDAHLEVFCLGFDPMRYDMVPLGTAPVFTIPCTSDAHDTAKRMVDWAEAQLDAARFGFSVRPFVVSSVALESSIAGMVRFADLIVATQPYGEGATQLQVSVLESVLFGTGAPVLVVPRSAQDYTRPFARPMVAWNESTESLSAVRHALPVLRSADRVDVVMVDPPSHSPERSDPGGAVTMMIARHGAKVEVSILSKTLPRVSDVLRRQITDRANDLLVMGAYGHSRFREALIGGVTRDLLEQTEIPLLMAH
ncbi:universal stress protein [Thalassorhabdomicrobium marinisediminis]|uniref:universal stress protein n=1 Tax=Thalassorhabdomicrobium marinisediminis TaxID=2170577 RepID=UPI002491F04A|nr:universal stress protein [Thalassorhabdomicrobium marinisediminis]